MKVFELLDELKEEIESSPKTMFSGRRAIEADVLTEIIADLVEAIPSEMKQAQSLLDEKEEMLEDARSEAAAIVASADEELQRRVAESEVLKEAQVQAAGVQKTAEGNAKEITIGAKEYADDILLELETYLGDYLRVIRKNRLQLSGKRRNKPTDQPPQ